MTAADESFGYAERAADDLLLLLTRVESHDVALPGPDDVAAVLTGHTVDSMPKLTAYLRRHGRPAARHAEFGFSVAADALGEAAMAHLLLSVRLLTWAADRAGMTHAQVVAEVLANTDVDDERGA